ncbi:MAG: DUF3343 domain-containing protein [Candidatus Zipacnadales bacterium]
MPTKHVIFLFPTTHAVMHAGQVLTDHNIPHDIVPRPKGLDADCGIAVSVSWDCHTTALAALRAAQREPSQVWEMEKP